MQQGKCSFNSTPMSTSTASWQLPHCYYSLSGEAPEGVVLPGVGGGDALVGGAGPEPAVDVDGLQVLGVAALSLEVALAAGGVDRAHVVCGKKKNNGA